MDGSIASKDQLVEPEVRPFRTLSVILKISERCNLACPYCYYFFMEDQTYKERPPLLQKDVPARLVDFINQGFEDLKFENVTIAFHGGEPMMLPKKRFAELCHTLRQQLNPKINLDLSIQTNGTLFDEDWIEIFDHFGVGVGISVDGTEEMNDKNRVDVHGNGSYQKIRGGVALVREKGTEALENSLGTITVLNAAHDIVEIAEHLKLDFEMKRTAFLLPDCNHDDGIPEGYSAEDYGEQLWQLFLYKAQNPQIFVRAVDEFLSFFKRAKYTSHDPNKPIYRGDHQIIVVCSNGEVQIDDTFIPTGEWRLDAPRKMLEETTLQEWLDQDIYDEIKTAYNTLHEKCCSCKWMHVCGGGSLENRFSKARKFDNPSIFCEGLKIFYERVTEYLVEHGYPPELIEQRLKKQYSVEPGTEGFVS